MTETQKCQRRFRQFRIPTHWHASTIAACARTRLCRRPLDSRCSGRSFEVTDPASGATIARVAALDAAHTATAIEAASVRCPPGAMLAPGTRRHLAKLVRADPRRQGGSGADHDARTGQAVRRIARRDRLRRLLRRVVRRGGKTAERRERDQPSARRRDDRAPRAARRRRHRHAVEFPLRHADPQGGRGTRGRLHCRCASLVGDATFGAGAGRTWRTRRPAGRRVQCCHRRRGDDRRQDVRAIPACGR